MIKTYQILLQELNEYKNPKTKIQRMVKNKDIFPIAKGLYETDINVNPFYLANPIYSPSYISFETALSFYELIPERVYAITNATYDKKKKKEYNTMFGMYTYRDVPKEVFTYGVNIYPVDGYVYRMARVEKALMDILYIESPILNMKEMRDFLFDNLRVNELIIDDFDLEFIKELAPLYHSRNVSLFEKMLRNGKLYD